MIKVNKLLLILTCSFAFGLYQPECSAGIFRKKKKNEANKETVKEKSEYDKFFSEKHTTVNGLIKMHKMKGKLYFELPINLLNRDMLLGSTVSEISDNANAIIGSKPTDPIHFRFSKMNDVICMNLVQSENINSDQDENIQRSIAKSNIDAILETFKISVYTPDSSSVVFDVTDFFVGDNKLMTPFDKYSANLSWGMKRSEIFQKDKSSLGEIKAFPDNVLIRSNLSYTYTISGSRGTSVKDVPFTALMTRSIILLDENPYRPRITDSRIAIFPVQITDYSAKEQKTKNIYYAYRWRLEPKDKEAFLSGKLSEPQKPIVFYVDNTFPEKWQEYISRSVEQWNKAFEKIGYKDAIRTKIYPQNDSTFNDTNLKYSCIRYVISPSEGINDNVWTDPRTGEIISANIYICHNLPMQIQRDRLLQTAAYDKNARTLTLNEEDFGKAFVSMLMRNIGHCLGLTDNLAGSAAYSADSLRSAGFTREKGISSSVMDDLTFNYLLSADLYKTGDSWCQESIGEYDYWAIRWLYGSFSNADTPEQESAMLKKLVSEKSGNPIYMYGKRQNRRAFYDPRSMSRDLGNNAVESAGFAFKNLSEVIAGMNNWIDKQDYDYSFRKVIYGYIINQVYDYMIHVFKNVGGIYINEKYAGDPDPTYQSVPKEIQKKSLLWIMQQIEDLTWLDNPDLIKNCGLESNISNFAQNYFGNFIFVQLNAMALSESKSDDPYTQLEAARDVMNFLMKESNVGKIPSNNKISLQSMFVDNLIRWSNLTGKASETSSSFSSILSLALKDTNKKNVLQYYNYIRKYPELINFTTENEGMSAMQSVRFNVLPERSHEWYGMLLDFKSSLRNAANKAPTEELKNTYLYQIYKIDKALSKD